MLSAIVIELFLLFILCRIHYFMAIRKGRDSGLFIGVTLSITLSMQVAGGFLGAFLYDNDPGIYGLAFLGFCAGAILSRWVMLFLPEKKEVVSESMEVLDR